MPGFYTITYPDSGRSEEYAGMRGNYYEFDDGSTIDVVSLPSWCCQCQCVTDAEWIESVDELRQEIHDLRTPGSWRYDFAEGNEKIAQIPGEPPRRIGFRENALKNANERLKWRVERTAGPKCLICGSLDVLFPDDNGNVKQKDTIIVRIEGAGMCSTDFNNWFYTPEGDRIPRDTKPSYWHHPELDGM